MNTRSKQQRKKNETKLVNLALQGGGAHGAFTWGVLDKLLEDGRLDIEAISGTSAGAMNAVVLTDGLARSGIDGARAALHSFWRHVSHHGAAVPLRRSPIDVWLGNYNLDHNPAYIWFDLLSRIASPYDFNPLNLNPLRSLLEEAIDFDRVRACNLVKLFVSATNVHTGRVKVFIGDEITPDAVMASSCLPFLFQAVEIDGVPYWDGGYMGNPVLFPFFYHCDSSDIVLVQINPMERRETPKTAREILNRVNEITFNSSLNKELRAIDFVSRLIEAENLDPNRYKRILMHIIEADEELGSLTASSKINAEWSFLTHLRDIGRDAASAWLSAHFSDVGHRSTVNLTELFEDTRVPGEVQ